MLKKIQETGLPPMTTPSSIGDSNESVLGPVQLQSQSQNDLTPLREEQNRVSPIKIQRKVAALCQPFDRTIRFPTSDQRSTNSYKKLWIEHSWESSRILRHEYGQFWQFMLFRFACSTFITGSLNLERTEIYETKAFYDVGRARKEFRTNPRERPWTNHVEALQ